MSEPPVVLDASALLAFLQGEIGWEQVGAEIPGAVIGCVNLSEVAAKLAESGISDGDIDRIFDARDLDVRSFDASQALLAGSLRRSTRCFGLSLGDRACLALGWQLGAVVLTADKEWANIQHPAITVRVIR